MADGKRTLFDLTDEHTAEVLRSGLFDETWYVTCNLDVRAAAADPLAHFVESGMAEGRNPNLLFDSAWYLRCYPDVAAAGMNPFQHYLRSGAAEGRNPHPLFLTAWYLASNPCILPGQTPLAAYLSGPTVKGCNPHPLFDGTWYLQHAPDVARLGLNPLKHFVSSGALEGRNPHPLFDCNWYMDRHPYIRAAQINPLTHFVQVGAQQGFDPNPAFDTAYYAWRYPDVAFSGLDPFTHYVTIGVQQERLPAPSRLPLPTSRMQPSAITLHGSPWAVRFNKRLRERVAKLTDMDLSRPFGAGRVTFSLLSVVEGTTLRHLQQLVQALQAQAFADFEWVILSTSADRRVTGALDEAAILDHRIRLLATTVGQSNGHAMRALLDAARGHYIIAIEPDMMVYPDSLAHLANALRGIQPTIVYSDEQELSLDGSPMALCWRWDFTTALAMTTLPAHHLVAIDAIFARKVQLYGTSGAASGAWDQWLRLLQQDVLVHHIPEVLAGRRVPRAGATADRPADTAITHFLAQRDLLALFQPVLDRVPDCDPAEGQALIKRLHRQCPPIELNFIVGVSRDSFDALLHNLRILCNTPGRKIVLYPSFRTDFAGQFRRDHGDFDATWIAYVTDSECIECFNACAPDCFAKALISSDVRVQNPDALWDAVGLLEIDSKAGIVSGPIIGPDSAIINAGYFRSGGELLLTPFEGCARTDVADTIWHAWHRVVAAPALFIMIRGEMLRLGVALSGLDTYDGLHGLEICLACAQLGYGVTLASFMQTERQEAMARLLGEGSIAGLQQVQDALRNGLSENALSPYLSRLASRFGQLAGPQEQSVLATIGTAGLGAAIPLNLDLDPDLTNHPTINLLLPSVCMVHMSGGPNTALIMAYRLADMGFALRIITTDFAPDGNLSLIWTHILAISGVAERLPHVEIIDGSDRSKPLAIGAQDVFLATAWWTAQMAKHASALVGRRPFIYLVQDYEPLFYPASTQYALALETYGLDHVPIFNSSLLREYFTANNIGRYGDPNFARPILHFEPAIPRDAFFVETHNRSRHRLLFYARPRSGIRNLFEIGVAALKIAVAEGILSPLSWDFIGLGEQFEPQDLGHGAILHCAPWLPFDDYAQHMRRSDILLSLMLSPHPSYPPIEMGMCSGVAITNIFANKTAERLSAISDHIIAVAPTIDAIVSAFKSAQAKLKEPRVTGVARLSSLPSNWDESFASMLPALADTLTGFGLRRDGREAAIRTLRMPGHGTSETLLSFLHHAAVRRGLLYAATVEPGLLSLVTPVCDTPPEFLEVLGRSVIQQGGAAGWEWLILDTGSTRADTLAALDRLRQIRSVRVHRSECNLSHIASMRLGLEQANGRYIVPLAHDSYIFPDALQVITWHLQKQNYPVVLYTDETSLTGTEYHQVYFKPDWDPILSINSGYTGRLCIMERKLALQYQAYTDTGTEDSSDWDTLTRFAMAGHVPVHVPEILYSRRTHEQSATGNAKPFVTTSQVSVIQRFLDVQPTGHRFSIVPNPLFTNSTACWIKRIRSDPYEISTIMICDAGHTGDIPSQPVGEERSQAPHIEVKFDDRVDILIPYLRRCAANRRLVHLISSATQPDSDEWVWEVMGLFDLFPSTVMVGGALHVHGHRLSAGLQLGFGQGCDSPGRNRPLSDAGCHDQDWRAHLVGAVPAQHAVVQADFLLEVIEAVAPWSPSFGYLGAWIGAYAAQQGKRIAYSPNMSAVARVDWAEQVSEAEKGRLVSAFANVLASGGLASHNLGRTVETNTTPVTRAAESAATAMPVALPAYGDWLDIRRTLRVNRYATPSNGPRITVLTTLDSLINPALFEVTAASVIKQRYERLEWVILAHGPIPPTLDAVLRRLITDGRVHVLRLAVNLGIAGGMRHVLEAASGEYALPLGGEDVLTDDSLQVLAAVIVGSGTPPPLLYSDEDIVTGQECRAPYFRPSWDPVLDLENSWVLHVCAFQRGLALTLGVYTDHNSEYCHEWDTIYRFSHAGHQPIHVAEVLYHWRSQNNQGRSETGVSQSMQHLLTRKLADRGLTDVYKVVPFPIYRGTEEWWLQRQPTDLPRTQCILIDSEADNITDIPDTPDRRIVPYDARWAEAMRDALFGLRSDTVVTVASDRIALAPSGTVLEAVKLFEFHDDVAIVSGRLLAGGQIASAGLSLDEDGRLRAPYDGQSVSNGYHFAMAWKPQSIAVPTLDLFFVQAGFLAAALEDRPADCTLGELGLWLGTYAASQGLRVAFTPLVTAELGGDPLRPRDDQADQLCWDHFRRHTTSNTMAMTPPQGAASYALPRFAD